MCYLMINLLLCVLCAAKSSDDMVALLGCLPSAQRWCVEDRFVAMRITGQARSGLSSTGRNILVEIVTLVLVSTSAINY